MERKRSTDAVAARATLRAMRSEVRWLQGHPREAIALADTAVAEAKRAGELEALARAYTALDGSYQMLGQPRGPCTSRWRSRSTPRSVTRGSLGITELNLGVQAYSDGRWDEAIAWYERAQGDCSRAGDRQHTAIAGANLGEVLVSRGELDEAEARCSRMHDACSAPRVSRRSRCSRRHSWRAARSEARRGRRGALVARPDRGGGRGARPRRHRARVTVYFAQAQARAETRRPGCGSRRRPASRRGRGGSTARGAGRPRPRRRASGAGRPDEAARVPRSSPSRRRSGRGFCTSSCSSSCPTSVIGERIPRKSPEELREATRLAQLLGVVGLI